MGPGVEKTIYIAEDPASLVIDRDGTVLKVILRAPLLLLRHHSLLHAILLDELRGKVVLVKERQVYNVTQEPRSATN